MGCDRVFCRHCNDDDGDYDEDDDDDGHQRNGVGRVRWEVKMEGKSIFAQFAQQPLLGRRTIIRLRRNTDDDKLPVAELGLVDLMGRGKSGIPPM